MDTSIKIVIYNNQVPWSGGFFLISSSNATVSYKKVSLFSPEQRGKASVAGPTTESPEDFSL